MGQYEGVLDTFSEERSYKLANSVLQMRTKSEFVGSEAWNSIELRKMKGNIIRLTNERNSFQGKNASLNSLATASSSTHISLFFLSLSTVHFSSGQVKLAEDLLRLPCLGSTRGDKLLRADRTEDPMVKA
jgi:hypothetical protein